MAAQKPSIPQGTRDFSPVEMVKRNYLFDTIRAVFQRYGYMPIETPAMEKVSTLMGKYGEEGDKLIFKIMPRGEKLQKALENKSEGMTIPVEEALRYDLTVPFARFVVQHQHDINFPFKRYQIQPVWRADRPQKGRYREFYQCDADVVGSDSLLNEVELVNLMDEVFGKLNLPVLIKINNRKILSGIAEMIEEKDKIVDITVAIDKLDKIGVDGVNKELAEKQVSEKAISQLQPIIAFRGNTSEKLTTLRTFLSASEIGKKGIEELEYMFGLIGAAGLKNSTCELDITLARGLNYYTGAIFEVKANTGTLTSSICGGGRYDNLTGIFGLPDVSGVGISFGADRIYDVMTELDLFPKEAMAGTKLMFAHFGTDECHYCLPLLAKVRAAGISAELYPDVTKKIVKQFEYANKKGIEYVVVVGSEEMQSGSLTLKNMHSGEQVKATLEEVITRLK